MVATIMNICPIMRLDDKGAIKAYGKVRGKKKAVEATVNAMEEHAQGGRDYDQRCFVCHSQCPEDAQMLIDALEERFPRLRGKIRLCDIGTIIGPTVAPAPWRCSSWATSARRWTDTSCSRCRHP